MCTLSRMWSVVCLALQRYNVLLWSCSLRDLYNINTSLTSNKKCTHLIGQLLIMTSIIIFYKVFIRQNWNVVDITSQIRACRMVRIIIYHVSDSYGGSLVRSLISMLKLKSWRYVPFIEQINVGVYEIIPMMLILVNR